MNQLCVKFPSEEVSSIVTIKKLNLLDKNLSGQQHFAFVSIVPKKTLLFITLFFSFSFKSIKGP